MTDERTTSARIADELRRRITVGELAPGDRLPSTRQITRDWGVAMATASKVLTALRQEGLVRAVPGVGTIVDSRPTPAGPRRRPETASLTRERIVAAAIRIADADGMAELSMRRVGAELGVATMALYRHVPSKDELLILMMNEVFTELTPPDPAPGGWRARLDALARLQWDGYRQHRWLASALSFNRPQLVPRAMVHTEFALASLDGLGLDVAEMLHAAIVLASHVRSIALSFDEELRDQQDTGMTADEWMDSHDHQFDEVIADGGFPMMARVGEIEDDALSLDSLFEFGLVRLLDGIGALIASRH